MKTATGLVDRSRMPQCNAYRVAAPIPRRYWMASATCGGMQLLPDGGAWVFVEVVGDSAGEVQDRAVRLGTSCAATDFLVVEDPVRAAALWRIREDGAGLSARRCRKSPTHRIACAKLLDKDGAGHVAVFSHMSKIPTQSIRRHSRVSQKIFQAFATTTSQHPRRVHIAG